MSPDNAGMTATAELMGHKSIAETGAYVHPASECGRCDDVQLVESARFAGEVQADAMAAAAHWLTTWQDPAFEVTSMAFTPCTDGWRLTLHLGTPTPWQRIISTCDPGDAMQG